MSELPAQSSSRTGRVWLMLVGLLVLATGAGAVAYKLALAPKGNGGLSGKGAPVGSALTEAPAKDSTTMKPDSSAIDLSAPDLSAATPSPDLAAVREPGPGPGSDMAAARHPRPKRNRHYKRRPTKPAPRPAWLTVHTQFQGKAYWAHVFVDGKKVGDSPIHRWKVPAGAHKVTVRRPGFKTLSISLTLRGGERRTVKMGLKEE